MSLSWSPNGKRLASIGFDGTVKILEVTTWRQERVLKCSSPYGLSVVWSPTGKRLVSITNDAVQIFDPETGDEVKIVKTNPPQRIPGPPTYGPNNVDAVWRPDGQFLALTGWSDGAVRILDGASGEEQFVLRGHTKKGSSASWSPDGVRLATASWDNTIRIWNTTSWQEKNIIRGIPTGSAEVAWSPDGRLLSYYVKIMKNVRVFDPVSGNERVLNTGAAVTGVAWRPTGTIVSVGLQDGTIQLWDPVKTKEIGTLGCGRSIDSLVWSADGQRLAAVPFMKNTICLWEAFTASQRNLEGHRRPVIAIAWNPFKPWLASAGYEGIVRLWRLDQ